MTRSLSELISAIEGAELHGDGGLEISSVEYDSRAVKPGALFTAVRGFAEDGHKYISQAVRAGASAVLCEEAPDTDCTYVLVPDTRAALALVAAEFYGRPADKMKIVGVTGTNGKTTVTNLLKSVIEYCTGEKVGLIGTNRNMVGDTELPTERTTPESRDLQELFARMAGEGCTWCVMEVSSHSLALKRVYGITFAAGVFTNLTQDHLDFHHDMESYMAAKRILMENSRICVINADDPYGGEMLKGCSGKSLTYSAGTKNAELLAQDVRLGSDRVMFTVRNGQERAPISLAIPGEFSVYNALAVVGCGLELGFDLTEIALALGTCGGVKGRAEVVPTGKSFTVLIDYAHTPDALENILNTVRGYARGRVIAVFGCGGDRDRTKRPIMGEIGSRLADVCYITSDNPRTEAPDVIIDEIMTGVKTPKALMRRVTDRPEAIREAMHEAGPGDVVVLAGKGHEDYQIVGHEKHHMDEREIVAQILADWGK